MASLVDRLWLAAGVLALSATSASAQPAPEVVPEPTAPAPIAPAVPASPPAEPAAPVPAEPTPTPPPPAPEPAVPLVHDLQFHGFISEGAFVSTGNDYIGASSRGSVKLFEVGLNVSTEVADRLRAGMQLFARDFGTLEDAPRFDWAFLDYRWRSWLGLRAGIVRMPFGLYNEYSDIDAGRVPILLPQSVYPFVNRDVLLSHRGFDLYGHYTLPAGGELDYQAWLGTLSIPANALQLSGATLDSIDTKYVVGARVFWQPVEGLRVGASYLRASIDFDLTLSDANTAALVMAGIVPADYDGKVVVSQRPDTWLVGSVEYTHDEWIFAAEYTRAFKHQISTLPPAVLPVLDEDEERFYVMGSYRSSDHLELGAYYSVHELDANDRFGHSGKYPERYDAFQRDLAATLRYDVNDHWLWKLEGHFIDGLADIATTQPHGDRFWGLFLLRTTVTF